MEPQVWEPCRYEAADWSMEHHPVWIPGVPVPCESTEMACLEETLVARSSERGKQQQLFQYYTAAASTPSYEDDPFGVFERKALELEHDNDQWGRKMHRYPENIGEVGEQYTVPMMVSIGPYHHGRHHLKKAEEAKHVAAYSCIKHSGLSVQEMYHAVVSVAGEARSLYDRDTMAGIGDDDFLPMMFYDACFLVQFMLWSTRKGTMQLQMHPWLDYFLKSKKGDIYHDILLLENQLPWVVLKTLASCTSLNLESFAKGFQLHNSGIHVVVPNLDLEEAATTSSSALYKPPHLIGYVRFHIVGTEKSETYQPHKETKVKSFSVRAMELAEMGITLTPSKTTKLAHMGFKEGRLSAELFLPPVLLTYARASYLFNMAAFEMTSQARPEHAGEDTAVCSYVQLLGMLMDREQDVQELRSKRILQGGGGLTDKETLDFFTSLRVLRGPLYHRTIRDVEMYKQNSRTWVKVYVFWYKYKKTVLAVLSGIAALFGIYGALSKR